MQVQCPRSGSERRDQESTYMSCAPLNANITSLHLLLLTTVHDSPDRALKHHAEIHTLSPVHEVDIVALHGLCRNRWEVNSSARDALVDSERELFAMQLDEGLVDGGVGEVLGAC
jgi:hypothetical protein